MVVTESIDLEDESIDVEILNSMAITNEYFKTALKCNYFLIIFAFHVEVVEVPMSTGMILVVWKVLKGSYKR